MSSSSWCALVVSACFSMLGCGQAAVPVSEPVPASEDVPAGEEDDTSPAPVGPEAPAGKRAPCTLGADQTCNDDERVSSLWGRCTELGVCECSPGFQLNPRGRCQPKAP